MRAEETLEDGIGNAEGTAAAHRGASRISFQVAESSSDSQVRATISYDSSNEAIT
jgi:hypothetical protein